MSNLHVYKASAGSGKTYQLTWYYLEMLFSDPYAFKSTLAVTFTNKAAGEMKDRILYSLYSLSKGNNDTEAYQQGLTEKFSLTKEEVKSKAFMILSLVLNDYSSFYVRTIDRFFQHIIRGFTFEIGLQSGFTLELKTDRILQEAVDLVLFEMSDDEELRKWLVDFARDKMQEGKSWQINADLHSLGREIFKEVFHTGVLGYSKDEDFRSVLKSEQKHINASVQQFESQIKNVAKTALELIGENGLTIQDFVYKDSGPAGYFKKILQVNGKDFVPGSRALNAMENADAWASKTSPDREFIMQLAEKHLMPAMKKIIGFYEDGKEEYFTALALKKSIFSYGILRDIADKIHEVTTEKNLFLISDASVFLKKIIGENEAPFVYEKTGNYFKRFMLDEFQDTSQFQWDNFYPLINNGLAEGFSSLVVGDVKQSIYRWRNSDWKILAAGIQEKFPENRINVHKLDKNWRSFANIVRFNNTVFQILPQYIEEKIQSDVDDQNNEFIENRIALIKKVFDHPVQEIPKKFTNTEGYVFYQSLESENNEEYIEFLSDKIPEKIRNVQKRGFKARDICILTRTKTEGSRIAEILMDVASKGDETTNFNLISNESIMLENNPAVKFLISILRYILYPSDKLHFLYLKYEFVLYLSDNELIKEPAKATSADQLSELSIEFKTFYENLDSLRKLPLFEMTEQLIQTFALDKNMDNVPFLQAFQDMVLGFINQETSDIYAFLNYWEKNKSSLSLQVSESQDAIQIMTIHKAKGLQFDVVIIPFCSWNIEPKTGTDASYLWCDLQNTPFNKLQYMPVKLNNQLAESFLKYDYFDEVFHAYVDNLNLLYVASTRSKNELYFFGKKNKPNNKGELKYNNVGDLMQRAFKTGGVYNTDFPVTSLKDHYDNETGIFEYGIQKQKESEDRDLSKTKTIALKEYPVNSANERLQLNLRNVYLEQLEGDTGNRLGYGTIMHEVFSYIRTKDDIDKALLKVQRQGKISIDEQKELSEKIIKAISLPQIAFWFNTEWKVRNESDLVDGQGNIIRPDRVIMQDKKAVVIDYKFGDVQRETHKKQVAAYEDALKNMGFVDVKGYLWYFSMDIVEEVF